LALNDPGCLKLFKLPFFSESIEEAVERVCGFIPGVYGGTEPIVINSNTDIVVQLEGLCHSEPKFYVRLANAFMVLPDGCHSDGQPIAETETPV